MTKITGLTEKETLTTEAVTLVSDRPSEGSGEFQSYKFDLANLVNSSAIPTFSTASGTLIPEDAAAIRTSSYYTPVAPYTNLGGATYLVYSDVDAAYVTLHPLTSFLSSDGRGWELDRNAFPDASQLGARYLATLPSSAVQIINRAAIQEACYFWGGCEFSGHCFVNEGTGPIWLFPAAGAAVTTLRGTLGQYECGVSCASSDSMTWPLFSIYEGYQDGQTDVLKDRNGTTFPGAPTNVGTGRQLVARDMDIALYYGKWTTAIYVVNTNGDIIDNVRFGGAHRGYFNPQGFNPTITNVYLAGLFYLSGRSQTQIEQGFPASFMIYGNHHTVCRQIAGGGCGTCVMLGGVGTELDGTRLEVSECSIILGATNYAWDLWNGSTFTGGSIWPFEGLATNIATESSRWGCIIRSSVSGRLELARFTGSAGAVPSSGSGARNPMVGLFTYPNVTITLDECASSVTSTIAGGFVNAGQPRIGTSFGTAGMGQSAALSNGARFILPDFRPNVPDNTVDLTMFSQLQHVGLTGMNGRTGVLAKNFGGTATIAAGLTLVDITFPTVKQAGDAQFNSVPAAVVDGASTLPAATYYYATTLIDARGFETGADTGGLLPVVPSFSVTSTYKTVVVPSGNRVDMTFFGFTGSGNYTRRIYRGTTPGYFTAYFEQVASDTTFSDSGQASDGQDVPPPVGATIPTQIETDAAYHIGCMDWTVATAGYAIPTANKATTGFRVTIPSALGSDTTFWWQLFR